MSDTSLGPGSISILAASAETNWVPLARSATEMVTFINRALSDRSWYWGGRQKIREEILGPLDGRATERFADVVLRGARRNVVNR